MSISTPYGNVSNARISLSSSIVTVVCPYPISMRQFVERVGYDFSINLGRISGAGMSDIGRLPRCETIERIILNSLDGTNTLSTVSLTRQPANPIGLVTLRPSTDIDMIVEDTILRSSHCIPYCFLLFL